MERTAPISSKRPIANPAFPAVLMPPELELVVFEEVALAADTDVPEVWATTLVEDEELVSTISDAEGATEVLEGRMAVGIVVELEVLPST